MHSSDLQSANSLRHTVAVRAQPSALHAEITALLEITRARTEVLLEPVSEPDASRQHDKLMSPLVWDLGHIAAFEALWLLQNLDGEIRFSEMPGLYNPFEHPRATRGSLDLMSLSEVLTAMSLEREKVLARLGQIRFDGGTSPLLAAGYVYRMVAQHEMQHQETMLQTLQLKTGEPYCAPRALTPPRGREVAPAGAMTRFPGGRVLIGTADRTAAYDNERPLHEVELEPFWIDVTAVTNAQFRAFVDNGGYADRALWSDAGWAWREESGAGAPKHWERVNGTWRTRSMDHAMTVDADRPVCHVNFHEAEAYARSVGRRLPTEFEWEAAATWDPAELRKRTFPWGEEPLTSRHANVDQLSFETAQVGAYAMNRSPIGCYGMIGDVWEWTSSDFTGYPGYQTFPYPEYSEAFFGAEYKVLRGGSWATAPQVARATFRNWDYPIRRQIFSGFRCARDD